MTLTPEHRRTLPMAGLTCGNRSPVTCHLRCGDACAKPVPNTTDTSYFRDVASAALNRRSVLRAGGVAAAAVTAAGALGAGVLPAAADEAVPATARKAAKGRRTVLRFTPIDPVPSTVDRLTVPDGFRWKPIISWGDPILRNAPAFDPLHQSPKAQRGQFGYNCDYLDVWETSRNGRKGLLVCNHEYTNDAIMFPPDMSEGARIRTAWMAYGMSVVELERSKRGGRWRYVKGARLNRRITLTTPFVMDGPAAGSDLLKTVADPSGRRVLGTMNNCSGGTTPWGTVLSGEENFNFYFYNGDAELSPAQARYGFGANDAGNWRSVDPRFDVSTGTGYENEGNRFGWIVELDPENPRSTPVKHTAMGRFKHEGASVVVNSTGRVVAYMGDDERFDYLYKFVSREKYQPGSSVKARRHNKKLLSNGDLYVARFDGDGLDDGVSDGGGRWIPLTRDGESMVPGFSLEEVLVHTRLAADAVSPTKMDRPEDVEPNPATGFVYMACTNNTRRTAEQVDEANPRPANKNGHVVEMRPRNGNHEHRFFDWNILLLCGVPGEADTYFGGFEGRVSPISCPDNVAFDREGNLWVSTDGQPGTIGYNDALHRVQVDGARRGQVQQFLSVPTEAETCGPVIHDDDHSVFVAVQHPGEDGSWDDQHSFFPDYVETSGGGKFAGPRPTVVQVTRRP
ncbi:MAG: phosphatase [Nocardioides sp.]|nr:phosphatase [Nocardioides sp.]